MKTRSTAFFISSGFAHRKMGMFFTPLITAPRLVHPNTELDWMYSLTKASNCSDVMLNPDRMAAEQPIMHENDRLANATSLVELGLVHRQRVGVEKSGGD